MHGTISQAIFFASCIRYAEEYKKSITSAYLKRESKYIATRCSGHCNPMGQLCFLKVLTDHFDD